MTLCEIIVIFALKSIYCAVVKYPLYNMNCDDFENLTILICCHILGSATIPFAKGKDGGKDGKFIGRANCIPSESNPWDGKIIIQAKHTVKIDASCSDADFQKILKDDVITAVNKLKADDDIDYYVLFTNRKLSGIQDSKIEKLVKEKTGIPTFFVSEEKIQMYLVEYPDVVRQACLNRLLLPFNFEESDLREVILLLHSYIKKGISLPQDTDFTYHGLKVKNELNKLGQEYFDDAIKRSMNDFPVIKTFLEDPVNEELADIYADAADELNAKITTSRNQFYEFEQILETCYDNIVQSNMTVLKGKKRLVRTLLHYMYCNCDIGKKQ